VTLTDEGTLDNGTPKRRQQRVYSDVLGRTIKAETLNWQDGSVYSTSVNSYNARDQVTSSRQYQGTEASGIYHEIWMTYDGYGRLNTKHVPEQQANATISGSTDHTIWAYNVDDTVLSVTDARGVTATFGYNTRHLLTAINHPAAQNLPASVPATANVTYAYDAAGNRMSMSDDSGNSVSYLYDSLSRLTSEARQFAGLTGTFTLAYQYNLGGQLKTVSDPGAATSFSYTTDNSGRLSSVDSTGLGATAPLASNAQYRASGALKSMAYGNTTSLAFSYNQRGLITNYSVGGVKTSTTSQAQPEGGNFQYYPDGQLEFASDLRTDTTALGLHDRAYSYDHAARLKEAYSGNEARDFVNGTNSGTQDGAFRQTYSYDPFGNLTTRTGRFWSEEDSGSDSYNSQNRNPLWEYDADGRLVSRNEPSPNGLTYQPLRFTYDAAGRRVQSTQTTSRPSPNPHSTVIFTTATTKVDSYDGEGMLLKSARTTQLNSNAAQTVVSFYLRSSVLGGSVIAEYDAGGVRQNAYVFAGGEILVQQQRLGDGTTRLMWQHLNPLTGDGLNTDAQGVALGRTTVDPMGVNLGDTDPFVSGGDPGGGDGEGMSQSAIDRMVAALIPGFGGPTCKVDGMVTGCRLAFGALSSGAGVLLSPGASTTPRMVVYQGQSVLAIYRATYDGYQGFIPVNASYTGNGNFVAINQGPPTLQTSPNHDTNFAVLNGVTGNSEAYLARSPQNPAQDPFKGVTAGIGNNNCPPDKQRFFTWLATPLGKMAQDLNTTKTLMLTEAAKEGGWTTKNLDHNQPLNNPFGVNKISGGKAAGNVAYPTLDAAIDYWKGRFGDRVQGTQTADKFINGLEHPAQGQPYNTNVDGYTKAYMDVYNSMVKYMKTCGIQ